MFFKGYKYQNSWNSSSNKKLDFSVNCEKCHKKVITRATPGRSLVFHIFAMGCLGTEVFLIIVFYFLLEPFCSMKGPKMIAYVLSDVAISTPTTYLLLFCEGCQVNIQDFFMEVFHPAIVELLQNFQFFSITMSGEFGFLHQKHIRDIVQWVNSGLKKVKLMVQ